MIFKEIYLYPSLDEYPQELTSQFRYETRSVCKFLERILKEEKFFTKDFRRLCIVGSIHPKEMLAINSSHVLVVEIPFNVNDYKSLSKGDLNDYFLKLLRIGFEKCKDLVPIETLIDGIEKFRAGGYKNIWNVKSKFIKEIDARVTLNCEMTTESFVLTVFLCGKEGRIFEDRVLETKPDEAFFARHLRRVNISGTKVSLKSHAGDVIYEIDLANVNS